MGRAHRSFTDIDEMLDRADLEAGKHVYVEKVMAVNVDEASRMVELAEQKNLVLSCAPSTILLPACQHSRALIGTGEIDRISFVHAPGAQRAGPLFDLAVHPVHTLTQSARCGQARGRFLGFARARERDDSPEGTRAEAPGRGRRYHAHEARYWRATFAVVDVSYHMLSTRLPAIQFWGNEGATTAPQYLDGGLGVFHRGDAERTVTHLPPTLSDRLGVAASLPRWLDCIRDGTQPVSNGRHARHVLDVLLSAQISARSGQAVELAMPI